MLICVDCDTTRICSLPSSSGIGSSGSSGVVSPCTTTTTTTTNTAIVLYTTLQPLPHWPNYVIDNIRSAHNMSDESILAAYHVHMNVWYNSAGLL